jgi:hypothetical protein
MKTPIHRPENSRVIEEVKRELRQARDDGPDAMFEVNFLVLELSEKYSVANK